MCTNCRMCVCFLSCNTHSDFGCTPRCSSGDNITAGEFFQNHEKYMLACPFLSCPAWLTSNPTRWFEPSQSMVQVAMPPKIRGLKWQEKRARLWVDRGSVWVQYLQSVSVPSLKSFGTLHQPWLKWPDGHLPQRDPDCESKLTDLSQSPKGWHFWGPFSAGVGHRLWTMARLAMTRMDALCCSCKLEVSWNGLKWGYPQSSFIDGFSWFFHVFPYQAAVRVSSRAQLSNHGTESAPSLVPGSQQLFSAV